jgi:hypothetical protein
MIEEFITTSTANNLATYISSHRKAIMNSVRKWAKSSHSKATSILEWLQQHGGTEAIEQIQSRKRKKLLEDNGKKRRVRISTISRKRSIVGFLSLLQH